jgi:hypothetical protein
VTCFFDDPIELDAAASLLDRWLRPDEAAAIVGGSYGRRRALALAVALGAVAQGARVLVASPDPGGTRLAAVLAGMAEESGLPAGEVVGMDLSRGPTLVELWKAAAALLASEPSRGRRTLVLIDAFDAFVPCREELANLRSTAQFLGAQRSVTDRTGGDSADLVTASDGALLVAERAPEGPVPATIAAWIGRTTRTGPADHIKRFARQRGLLVDPASAEEQRDGDGALFGWRLLDLTVGLAGSLRLRSPAMATIWPHPVQEARCSHHHPVPNPTCGCGIDAFSSLEEALANHPLNRPCLVTLVKGWGRVAHHERGWRAQFCQPVAIFGDVPVSVKTELEQRYECDVVSLYMGRRVRSWTSGRSSASRRSPSTTRSQPKAETRRRPPTPTESARRTRSSRRQPPAELDGSRAAPDGPPDPGDVPGAAEPLFRMPAAFRALVDSARGPNPILLWGPTGSGKSFLTDRIVAGRLQENPGLRLLRSSARGCLAEWVDALRHSRDGRFEHIWRSADLVVLEHFEEIHKNRELTDAFWRAVIVPAIDAGCRLIMTSSSPPQESDVLERALAGCPDARIVRLHRPGRLVRYRFAERLAQGRLPESELDDVAAESDNFHAVRGQVVTRLARRALEGASAIG